MTEFMGPEILKQFLVPNAWVLASLWALIMMHGRLVRVETAFFEVPNVRSKRKRGRR